LKSGRGRLVEPGTVEPGTVEPGTVEPGTVEPGTVEPGTVQSERRTVEPNWSAHDRVDSTPPAHPDVLMIHLHWPNRCPAPTNKRGATN
jgi:hypothetical protein